MSTPQPETAAPNPDKPSRFSIATVLFALLLLIPGLCFGIAIPRNKPNMIATLLIAWGVVLLMWLLVLLVKGIQYLVREGKK